MIDYRSSGDLLNQDAEALVNTVNCVGVMGRGVSLQFKKTFPDNFKAYTNACERGEVQPGRMFVFETGRATNPRYIINFPTKRHWRGKSRMEDIESGLEALVHEISERNIGSIAIPPLGSGLGGLNWSDVRWRVDKALGGIPTLHATIFEPSSEARTVRNGKTPDMTPGRAVLVGLMHRYLQGLLDPFVSLLEIHKLMYFMQTAGEPLRLQFHKAPYGPYASNLGYVLQVVEGHFTSGYADGGDAPHKPIELVPGAFEDAAAVLKRSPDSQKRFDRVVDLVDGFESPSGLELLATVHWVMEHEPITSRSEVISLVHEWAPHKRRFSQHQIGVALNVLSEKRWIREPEP